GRDPEGGAAPAASCPGRRDAAPGRRADGDRAGAAAPGPGHDRALCQGRLHRAARGRAPLARRRVMTDLRQAIADYLRLRRSLGHQMAEAAYLLADFAAFMDQRGEHAVTIAAALDWVKAREPGVVTTASPRRITAVRGIAPATEVPPLGLVPYNRRRGQIFLYSDADIAAIMTAAKQTIREPLRAAT